MANTPAAAEVVVVVIPAVDKVVDGVAAGAEVDAFSAAAAASLFLHALHRQTTAGPF